MNWAIIWRVFKDRRGTLVALAMGMAIFDAIDAALYPKFHAQAELVMKLVPSFIRALMASVPLDRPDGFAAWVFSHPIWVAMACAWPIGEAASAIAGEFERGTLGWVLAAPVSRTRYLVARVATMILGEAAILACAFAALWIGLWMVKSLPAGGPLAFVFTYLQAWMVYSTLGAVVLLASACASRAAWVYGVGIGLAISSAILGLISSLWSPLQVLRAFSLLAYFHPFQLLRGSTVGPWVWAIPAIVAGCALIGAWWILDRRDLAL